MLYRIPLRCRLPARPATVSAPSLLTARLYAGGLDGQPREYRARRREPGNLPYADALSQHVHTPAPFQLVRPAASPSAPSAPPAVLALDPEILAAMRAVVERTTGERAVGQVRPTAIQALAVDYFVRHRRGAGVATVLAAETGSGKTLAYLTCLFQQLREEEQAFSAAHAGKEENSGKNENEESEMKNGELEKSDAGPKKRTTTPSNTTTRTTSPAAAVADSENSLENLPCTHTITTPTPTKATEKPMHIRRLHRPRAVVLVPTLDLLEQVGAVAKEMSHHARLRTAMMSASTPAQHLKRIWAHPVDVLVTTPRTLRRWLSDAKCSLAETRWVVLDEADFLLDQGFETEAKHALALLATIARTRGTRAPPTLCLATATVPRSLLDRTDLLPGTPARPTLLATPHLHRALPQCTQRFVTSGADRYPLLRTLLQQYHSAGTHTLVFCNTRAEVERVAAFLARQGFPHVHKCVGEQTAAERRATWAAYRAAQGAILVATDLASRGLDTLACTLVINFDFPRSALEYVHRIGRTARAGRTGLAISLVTKQNSVLVQGIQQRLRRKQDFAVARAEDARG